MTESMTRAQGMTGIERRKARRMVNITTTLPIQLLDKIDELVEDERVPSRSYVIREAIERLLKDMESC